MRERLCVCVCVSMLKYVAQLCTGSLALTQFTVCFTSTEFAELSPETCVIGTEGISCS